MQKTRQNIVISDRPESKIHFLEQSLAGQDWRATVIFAGADAQSLVDQKTLENHLLNRGYLVERATNEQGQPTLNVHHLGQGSNISDIFREAGFLRGAGYALSHPAVPFQKPVDYSAKAFDWLAGSVHNPARANGVINTTAEVFLTAAGPSAKSGKKTDIKNVLQTGAGASFLTQSAIYLLFGKNNEDRAFQRIEQKLDKTIAKGEDISAVRFDQEQDKKSATLKDKITEKVMRYPVQIGAMANNIGMGLYLGHAHHEKKFHLNELKKFAGRAMSSLSDAEKDVFTRAMSYTHQPKGLQNILKSGYRKDVMGACMSMVAWSVLMIPPIKEKSEDEKAQENPGIFKRVWHNFRVHTPQYAGLLTLGSSSSRLMGSISKNNKIQSIGETIYIGGDLALMLTNSHEYGGDAKLDPERLSQRIVEHAMKLPTLMGPKAQADFVEHTVQYWLDKHKADNNLEGKVNPSCKFAEESAVELKQALTRKMQHQYTERLRHFYEGASQLIVHFPEGQREEVATRVSNAIAAAPWMKASAEEIKTGIHDAMSREVPASMTPISEEVAAKDISLIAKCAPNIQATNLVSSIYDAIAPFMPETSLEPKKHIFNIHHIAKLSPAMPQPALASMHS